MEGIHGVDTSWLHHYKAPAKRSHSDSVATQSSFIDEASNSDRDDALKKHDPETSRVGQTNGAEGHHVGVQQHAISETKPVEPQNGHAHHHHLHSPLDALKAIEKHHVHSNGNAATSGVNGTTIPSTATAPPPLPSPLQSPQQKKGKDGGKSTPSLGRRPSWISNLSSKFGGSKNNDQKEQQSQQAAQSAASFSKATPSPRQDKPDPVTTPVNPNKAETVLAPSSPKPGAGFLSSALRRFSSSTGTGGASKTVPNGGICPRMTLNVDHHRDRCQIQDLQPAKLRRVAFCVDVEIAATPVYRDDSPDDPTLTSVQQRKRSGSGSDKKRQAKTKDKSEGEALKNPHAMAEKKERAAPKPRVSSNDMFEVPDEVDEAPTKTPNPARPPPPPPRQPSPPKPKSRPPPPPRISSSTTPPLHSDFGPSGMFEVDDFDEVPVPKIKVSEQRNGVGGSVHHDFGRHGMFEIPSASEDEGGLKPRSKPRRKSSAASNTSDRSVTGIAAPSLPGHTPSEHLMFELPDIEIPNDSAIADAVSQAAEPQKEKVTPVTEVDPASSSNGETDIKDAKQKTEDGQLETSNGSTEKADAEKVADEEPPPGTRKKEKKKKHEEERKQRKERKKQAAIADGKIPVELTGGDANDSAAQQTSNKPKIQNRPTTDPLRIYRRCCSLRETTPLPRVVEQLSSLNACDPSNPAIVLVLDLSGQNIDMADLVTLSDWLGVVPVQKLVLDRCGLTDETLRMVLAALLAVKTAEQAKHNKHLVKKPKEKTKDKRERKGVIAKLSLKDNRLIGRQGWLHIAYFINMSKSLKAIDLSMISFPKTTHLLAPPSPPLAPSTENEDAGKSRQGSVISQEAPPPAAVQDPFDIFIRCLTDRLGGDPLEEIVMSECDLSGERIERLMDAIIACRCIRLGLADNNLDPQGLRAIVKYIRSGNCLGIDLGGNDFSDLQNQKILLQGLDFPDNQLLAISLAHTNISTADLKIILPVLASIPGLRFIDFSLNQRLFSESENAIPLFGRYLPRIRNLKRFHLNNVGLRAEHAIALAEICAETEIAHISILENPALTALANATDEADQEEACALYASLMTAVRVSKMIMCIDIDVPSKDNSEVVKALAKQVVAYSLANMEAHELYQSAAALISEPHGGEKAVTVPDVLLHVVGHVDYVEEALDNEPPAPDQDYLVGGTGVVRALSVVLGNKNARRLSRDVTPIQSGTTTPRRGEKVLSNRKAKDMSKQLLQSARKIRHRLQPALVRARTEGEDSETCRKLVYLDNTLDRVITRFEEEYPECRDVHAHKLNKDASATATSSPDPEHQAASTPAFATPDERPISPLDEEVLNSADDEETLASSLTRSRHGSDVSLASRHLVNEEGRLHRFHERMRRELEPVEPKHVEELKNRIDAMDGEAIKHEVETKGTDAVLRDMNATIDSLRELEKQGGNTWEKCKSAGMQCSSKTDSGAVAAANHRDSAILDDEDDSGLEMTG